MKTADRMEPVAELGAMYDTVSVAFEVSEMAKLLGLLRERAELVCELAAHGVNWSARPLSRAEIKAMVARRRGVTVAQLEGQDCHREQVEARHEAMYLMRKQVDDQGACRWSFGEIGQAFGGRDHTTAVNACRRHEARLKALPA